MALATTLFLLACDDDPSGEATDDTGGSGGGDAGQTGQGGQGGGGTVPDAGTGGAGGTPDGGGGMTGDAGVAGQAGAVSVAGMDGGVAGAGGTPEPPGPWATGIEIQTPVQALDVLFVIDNSGSMREEQESLRRNFPLLISALAEIRGGLPDVHIGVVTTDVGAGNIFIAGNPACNRPGGDRGRLQAKAGCGLRDGARFIASAQNGQVTNFDGKIEDVFACLADVGTNGCGFEHQLQAARLALAKDFNPENAGFLREDAFLAIVFISDEDDCSAPPDTSIFGTQLGFAEQQASLRCALDGHECGGVNPTGQELFATTVGQCRADPTPANLMPVQEFVDLIKALKPGRPDRIAVTAIAGWTLDPAAIANAPYVIQRDSSPETWFDLEPVCSSNSGNAIPGLRFKSFVDAFGGNGAMESICEADLSPALARLGRTLTDRLTPVCFNTKELVDLDPGREGTQPLCELVEETVDAGGKTLSRQLPPCTQPAQVDCWRIADGIETGCSGEQVRLTVARATQPTGEVRLRVRCLDCKASKDNPNCR